MNNRKVIMRELTIDQKNLLDKWCQEHSEIAGNIWFSISDCEEFTTDFYDELEALNDTEILYQNIESYVQDWNG